MKNNRNLNYFIRTYKVSSKKAYLTVPYDLNEIIIGSALGDLSVQKAYTNSDSRLQFSQSFKNKVYIDHLYSLFQEHCSAKPIIRTKFSQESNTGEKYASVGFKTLSLPCFNVYRELFYRFDGTKYTKVVPSNLFDLLTAKGLAYWVMDDGSRAGKSKGIYLSTESFTLNDNSFLIEVLEYNFGLNCRIHKSIPGKYKIYIQSKSRDKLVSLIMPHLLPHFYYKIDKNR